MSAGASFTYSGTLTQNDTISFTQVGTPCLQPGPAYCTNGAGVVVVAGSTGVGTANAVAVSGVGVVNLGSLLMTISGVGTRQVFPANPANGLGSASPPPSLALPATTLGSLGFGMFSVNNPTITFFIAAVNYADNTGSLTLVQPAPDLTVSKTANPATFTQGQNGVYTITASNVGNGPSSGTITVTDTLDSNLTLVSAAGPGWSCNGPPATVVTCTSSTPIPAATSAGPGLASPITITVNVAANAPASVTNNVTVTGGGGVNTNNSFQLVSIVNAPNAPKLSVSQTATAFSKGQNGVYTILVSNSGTAPSSGTITVTDTLDPNLTFVSATGSTWTCNAAHVVTCTTSAAIAAGASAPSITITVNVAANAPVSVTNNVTVAGGGSANNSSQLVTTVVASVSAQGVPATTTPVLILAGMALIGMVVWLRRRAAYPG
jgi:uncharacterized repeat protein (TIGR01451 family)